MSSFIKSREIPKHKIVEFLSGKESLIGNAIAIMDEEVSIKVSSAYGDLSPFGGNNLMTVLSGATGGKILSGQFALQSAQIWQKTEPLSLSFSVKFYMNNNAYNDVIVPINNLMGYCLPVKSSKSVGFEKININAGFLIPPGPNLQTIISQTLGGDTGEALANKLSESFDSGGRGVITIKIGNFTFHNMVLKEANPTFSTVVDESGYPVSATLSIDAMCFEVCTTSYISSVFGTPPKTKE